MRADIIEDGVVQPMGPFSGIMLVIGAVVVLLGIVVRKYKPQSQGNVNIWIFDFVTPEWFGLMSAGMMFLAIGIFLAWAGL